MIATPALAPPAIEQPAPFQVSYGLVTGRAARGTARIVVSANGRQLVSHRLHRGRFSLRVSLPLGDARVRVTMIARDGRRAAATVRDVFALPAAARPRIVHARLDHTLARRLGPPIRSFHGTAAYYVQSLTGGMGAARNANARFPAASTVKLAIATTVLSRYEGVPARGSSVDSLLRRMITTSDDEAANALLVWLGGSTSGGGYRVNDLMRSLGLKNTLMYGGYETRMLSARIPLRVDEAPAFGVGKYTTAYDMTSLWRALWLTSGAKGQLRASRPGLTPADARYLLWVTAHVRDLPKLDTTVRAEPGVAVFHKAGWISTVRHDTGLVFWPGGVFVAGVMTWRPWGVSLDSDRLAGRVARIALARFRRTGG